MNQLEHAGTNSALETLRRFIRRRAPVERCELCGQGIGEQHEHLLETAVRRLYCVCGPCAVLFSGQTETKYKRVPRRVQLVSDFRLSDATWDAMMIPIGMAFFCRSGRDGKVTAFYPSPAGATESLLAMEVWKEVEGENSVLARMQADVEALLVNRLGHARGQSAPEYYLVPIDECFRLVGILRSRWKGLSGGSEVWQQIGEFFAEMKHRSVPDLESAHA